MVKVRRVGNSNVVTLPIDLERLGFTPGESVAVQEVPGGAVMLLPSPALHEHIRRIAREEAAESRDALDLLAAYDRGELVLNEENELVPRA